MGRILKIFGGLVLTLAVQIFAAAQLALTAIGATTALDDFDLLKQRAPKVLGWLFQTPWYVPTILLILMAIGAAWLLYSGIRGAAIEPDNAAQLATLTDLDSEIKKLRDELGQMPIPTVDLGDLCNRIDSMQGELGVFRHHLLGQVCDDIRTQIKRELAAVEAGLNENKGRDDSRDGSGAFLHNSRVAHFTEMLELLGYSRQDVTAALQSAADIIKGDAEYMHLTERDGGTWNTGEQKRKWHIKMAYLNAYKRLLDESTAPRAHGRALLEKLS